MADTTVQLDALEDGDDVAVETISTRMYQQVKLIGGAAADETKIEAGGGAEAGALRVTIANDSTGVVSVDDNGASLTVDGPVTDTELRATPVPVSGTVTASGPVTDAELRATPVPMSITDTSFAVADGSALGEGVLIQGDDGTDRKNINVHATTGDVQVDVTNTVTVDGTITAVTDITNPITANPASGTIDTVTNLAQMGAAAISMNTGVRDAGTQRVTIATNDSVPVTGTVTVTATNLDVQSGGADLATEATLATIDTDTGNIATAVQLIDDAVYADDAAFTLTSSKVMAAGAIRDDSLSTLTAVEGDAVPLRVGSTGALHVTGAGGGTQYNVDDASPTTVTMAGAVRDDSLTTLTEADGDATLLRVSSTGALHVTGGGGGTEYTEDVATPATIVGTATMIERDDVLTATPIEGDWLSLKGSAEGALWTQDFNSDAILSDTSSIDGKITACNTGAVVISSGTVTANLSATDNGVLDQIELNTSYGDNVGNGTAAGSLRVSIASDTTGVLSIDDNGGSLTVDSGAAFTVQEDGALLTAVQLIDNPIVAHDAAASGSTGVNMAGGYATNNIEGITQVANADASHIVTDLNGVTVTRNGTTLEELIHNKAQAGVTATTSTAVTNFTAVAGVHNYVTSVTVFNSNASTNTFVKLQDGSGGGTEWIFPAPATGGTTHNFDPPLKQTTANTALYFATDAAVSTVYVFVNGFQAQG